MDSIKFLGASGMVTGSCYLLTGEDGEQLLIDLGMFQGDSEVSKLNYEPLGFDPSKLTVVCLTHAHLDHCGRLPLLVKAGFKGKIYMTKATRMLTVLALADAAKVAAEDHANHEVNILYTEEDVDQLITLIEIVEYDHEFTAANFKVTFRDAGHILGSASIEITGKTGRKIVFSGDLGNSPEDIIRPTEKIQTADFVVMESTYGDRLHREEDPSAVIKEEINGIEKDHGVLLIPSFSIERAQEILHRLNHLKNDGKIGKDTKIFLDSPMAIHTLEVFRRSPELFNQEITQEMKSDDPFDFPGLVICQSAEESKSVLQYPAPKVIISGSGMMHGGRILHHAVNYLPDSKNRLLLVGYQAVGTLGRQLLEGAKKVYIYGQETSVAAHVREVEAMSCHADQKKLLAWLGVIKGVKNVYLTHGENKARQVLSEKIKTGLGLNNITIPNLGELITF